MNSCFILRRNDTWEYYCGPEIDDWTIDTQKALTYIKMNKIIELIYYMRSYRKN